MFNSSKIQRNDLNVLVSLFIFVTKMSRGMNVSRHKIYKGFWGKKGLHGISLQFGLISQNQMFRKSPKHPTGSCLHGNH